MYRTRGDHPALESLGDLNPQSVSSYRTSLSNFGKAGQILVGLHKER